MNDKTLALVNPAAGFGKCGKLLGPMIDRLLHAGVGFDVVETKHAGHATELAREAYASGYRKFIAVGGDGTSFEIVNGLFPEALNDEAPTLGFLPLGTGNSFLRDFTKDGVAYATQAIIENRARPCDVIRLKHKTGTLYYINILSLGFVADVCTLANERFKKLGAAGYGSTFSRGKPMPAKQKTLEDLFLLTLKDVFYAEKQILRNLPKMAKAVESDELRQAFEQHRTETDGQIQRLEQIFEQMGKRASGKTCESIQGLVAEGQGQDRIINQIVTVNARKGFGEDRGLKLSASLAYYTLFSIGPLFLLVLSIVSIVYGQEATEGKIFGQLNGLLGADAARNFGVVESRDACLLDREELAAVAVVFHVGVSSDDCGVAANPAQAPADHVEAF